MVVGAYSVAFHGYPRYTGDLDLWINPGKENAQKTIEAIEDFGFGSLDLTWEVFNKKDQVIQLVFRSLNIIPTLSDASTAQNQPFHSF